MTRTPLLGRASYPHFTTVTTRWADNDAYGHVNNIVYYGWFDTAVNGWLIQAGLLDMADGGPIGLVAETGCRYASSLAYPQAVEIGLGVEQIGTSSVHYRLGVFAVGAADAAAEGRFVHVYVDRRSRRPVEILPPWRDRLETLKLRFSADG